MSFFSRLREDIRAVKDRDPAARNGTLEILLTTPGLHALWFHRLAHTLWLRKVPLLPRLISHLARFLTGIEIHPGATIGQRLFIDHGMGIVIGETAEIGDDVTIYQSVTLGGTDPTNGIAGKRHPTLEDDVVVGVGASVLGAITVGRSARVGGGAVVVKDVPPHSTAVGVPARIVATRDPSTGETRRVEQLPDPEGLMLRGLRAKVLELEARLADMEEQTNNHHAEHHLTYDALPTAVWAALDGMNGSGKRNDVYEEDFLSGLGI